MPEVRVDGRVRGKSRRKHANTSMWLWATLCTAAALVPLASVLYYVGAKGLANLNLAFFTHPPAPVGETGGGMANAIVGTLILIGIASASALPLGLLGGIYLAEFGGNRVGWAIRFAADVLSGVPSIVIGVLVYAMVVVPMRSFSALAGGLALGVLMLPILIRTTEEMVRLVPVSLREGALSLGASHWSTVTKVVLLSARGGIITGVLLAVARVAGETAPLLFTAFGNSGWSAGLGEPIASLPVQIFSYAVSPYPEWQAHAWTGALVLVGIVVVLSAAARYATRGRSRAVR